MIDDFTLPNYKMKDCQTVKYDWLVCWSKGRLLDWFAGEEVWQRAVISLLGKEQRELARHMHEVQGVGMVSVQNAGEEAW